MRFRGFRVIERYINCGFLALLLLGPNSIGSSAGRIELNSEIESSSACSTDNDYEMWTHLKSGIPAEVDMPAPVITTMCLLSSTHPASKEIFLSSSLSSSKTSACPHFPRMTKRSTLNKLKPLVGDPIQVWSKHVFDSDKSL